jgi:hypothetical protein
MMGGPSRCLVEVIQAVAALGVLLDSEGVDGDKGVHGESPIRNKVVDTSGQRRTPEGVSFRCLLVNL